MSSAQTTEDGLRRRKREALRSSIESAAIDLAIEHGYDNVTVDMICEASMISPRTFFNYFGSKEGVILGATPPMPSDDEIAAFVHSNGSDVLGDFIGLITASVVEHETDATLFRTRRRVIQQTPELSTKETARMGELEDQFLRIVVERFRAHGRDPLEDPELEDEARMVVALTTGVMHYVMRKWFDTEASTTTRQLLERSIALIRRITSTDTAEI